MLRILHLEDDAVDAEISERVLHENGVEAEMNRVHTFRGFSQALHEGGYALVLADYTVPGVDPLKALQFCRQVRPETPFIFLSGTLGEDVAIETLKLGATDYVLKNRLDRLAPAVRRALQEAEVRAYRQRAEEELQRFKFFSENANDAHFLINQDARVLYANKLACERLGYSQEELLRLTLSDIDPDFPKERVLELLYRLKQGRVPPFEAIHRRRDGSTFPVEITSAALESNGDWFIFSTVRDITERKQHEFRLAHANEELERKVRERTAELTEANQELQNFTYTVAHDLRAPLRHVAGFIEILRRSAGERLSPMERESLNNVKQATLRMGRLIDDLLDFARLGRAELRCCPVDVAGLVAEVRQQLAPETQGRRVEWHVGQLPTVFGDAGLLRQVFFNVLHNALKFTRPCRTAVIAVTGQSNEAQAIITVRDNGVGFDMRNVDKLFGVFQRLHHEREFEGTGIGLAHVQRILQRHGGRVWAEGSINQGAAIHIALPVAKGMERAA